MWPTRLLPALLAATSIAGVFISPAQAANSDVKITEWMYQSAAGGLGEFVEFTNLGSTAINFSGWSYADSSAKAGDVSLSAFGVVNAGESVLLTDTSATNFRSTWNLSNSVKVIGDNAKDNLGRSDAINLYDNNNALIDSLIYNDQGSGNVKGPRTNGISAHPGAPGALGANNANLWISSAVGDSEGSYLSATGEIGSPGKTAFAPAVPIGSTESLLLSALITLGTVARRRAHKK